MDSRFLDKIVRENKTLSGEEQLDLIKEWKASKNKAVLDRLVLSNMKVVAKEAYRLKRMNRHLSLSDLLQEGVVGLSREWIRTIEAKTIDLLRKRLASKYNIRRDG